MLLDLSSGRWFHPPDPPNKITNLREPNVSVRTRFYLEGANAKMKTLRKTFLVLGLAAVGAIQTEAAVKITALQMISTDENGKIQGVGAHRFKTTNHGGQPCLYLIEGDNLNGTISNGPGPAQNGVNLTLSVGTHTYTIYAENANSV